MLCVYFPEKDTCLCLSIYADIIIWNDRHFITHAATSFRLDKLCYWMCSRARLKPQA